MKTIPNISVVLCTYNGAPYIAEQIHSILAQTLPATEIILSDDGSSDNTVEIAQSLLESAQINKLWRGYFTILTRSEPVGVAENFYLACLETKFPFIVLCDQDDIWESNKLELQSQIMMQRPDLLLSHSDAALIDENNAVLPLSLFETLGVTSREFRSINSGKALDVFLKRNLVTGATVMMKRVVLNLAGPIPRGWIHDEWFALVASVAGGVDASVEKLIRYRQHDSNVIGVTKLSFKNRISKLREPRTERNYNLYERANSLLLWFEMSQLGKDTSEFYALRHLFRENLRHQRARINLPDNQMKRIIPVLIELLSGRYSLFGRGLQDVLRDLVQPE